MKSCPECKTELEQFELSCHNCGQIISGASTPPISDIAPSKEELSESYKNWLKRGKECIESKNLDEACNALREAVRRSRVLDNPQEKEIEARRLLAEALEALGKAPEAADQYRIIAQESESAQLKEHWLKKSQDLLASSSLAFDELFKKEEFRPLLEKEQRFVPLYCSGCKRLLAEAEVYGFRRGLGSEVRCWCGTESRPLAKEDSRHLAAFESSFHESNGQRALAIELANQELPGAKKRNTACALAFLTGWCGGHKFYLGDTVSGWIYFFWFWTLVPLLLSIYEGMIMAQMSLVTFNMTYNLDVILQIITPEESLSPARLFSLETADAQNPDSQEVAKNGPGRKEL